jgi:hypothetical protein
VYRKLPCLLIGLQSIECKCKFINFNQYNSQIYICNPQFLWPRIVLYPLSVTTNSVVCPQEPFVKSGRAVGWRRLLNISLTVQRRIQGDKLMMNCKEFGSKRSLSMWDFKFSRLRVWSSGTCCLHHQGGESSSSPWWWRQHVPLKRRSTIILHGSTSQKTNLNFTIVV